MKPKTKGGANREPCESERPNLTLQCAEPLAQRVNTSVTSSPCPFACLEYGAVTHRSRPSPATAGAFTLIELLVVVALLAILAALLLPALSKAKGKVQAIACLSNYRQLEFAWQLYTDDHHGDMPQNRSSSVPYWRALPGSWVVGNAQMDDSFTNVTGSALYPYHHSMLVHHCPTDRSTFSNRPDLMRWRSCMLSFYLNGNWQEGTLDSTRFKTKIHALLRPSSIFTFIDTSEWTICDGGFMTRWLGMTEGDRIWNDYPTDRHNQGATLAFVDGRAERWKWLYPKNARIPFTSIASRADLQDLRRLQAAIPDP